MKWKIVLTLAVSACLVLGLSIYSLATDISMTQGTHVTLQSPQGTDTGIVIAPSPKVSMFISTTTTSYAIGSCHASGDKEFGAASNSGNIYFQGIGVGTCTSASNANPGGTDSSAFASWSSI
jgi:hypothetical protein